LVGLDEGKERSVVVPPSFRATFSSLRNRNLRIYLIAQIGSNVGAWIQITAENWLVLQLSDSGVALGITNALQFGPLVVFGLYGGVIVDRVDRRRLLFATQSALALLATTVGLLIVAHLLQLWMIWLAALLLGLVMCLDKPALLAFVKDLAGQDDLANAVALNNAAISSGRMIGPLVSGLLIAAFGSAPSFFINAVSFAVAVLALSTVDVAGLHAGKPVEASPGQVREGLAYVWNDSVLRLTVIAMSTVFVAAYNFQVLVPLLTTRLLSGASALLGIAMSALGLGAVTGSLLIASWTRPGSAMIAVTSGVIGTVYVGLALPLGTPFVLCGLFLLGLSCGLFNVTVTGLLQLRTRDDMRGRVMVLYPIGILGSGLLGAPLAGMLADRIGMQHTFLIVAAVCLGIAATTGWIGGRSSGAELGRCRRPNPSRRPPGHRTT
jgi:MFS family permease